ncbi:phytase [Luteimonas yindakuii]|uniref:Phytase n=1 Tax=Luteimonas yindakuii TaxID=2565782 RepID=A0A4Z1RA92_9GAMM|nr:phytase [Luteimonas yindakuii]TKS53638.1 phytase [Luteimonas yindakuii]
MTNHSNFRPSARGLAIAALALALAACSAGEDAEDHADRAREAVRPAATVAIDVAEAFATPMTPEDNIDSVASWTDASGRVLLLATAKSTHRLVVYDGSTGAFVRHVGGQGSGAGQFDRPNGIAVAGDLAFVVERDNRRVQVLQLPGMQTVAEFGSDVLQLPYGIWVHEADGGWQVYVTDAYMAGEDAQGEDILPPLDGLDRRVHRFAFSADGTARHLGAFGDTSPEGALRVVESLWGDPANDQLLIAEEDETYANEFKVYDLEGRFSGRTIGAEFLQAQAEGIVLKTCANGSGWWITTEQGKDRTAFHLFERGSLDHVGAVSGPTVANTDGIWLHDAPTMRFPEGVLYAVHDDQGAVAIDWRHIATALELPACAR